MKKNLLLLFIIVAAMSWAQPPEPPTGFRWVLWDQYSDEFDGDELDTTKWRNSFVGWDGRPPARFEPSSV